MLFFILDLHYLQEQCKPIPIMVNWFRLKHIRHPEADHKQWTRKLCQQRIQENKLIQEFSIWWFNTECIFVSTQANPPCFFRPPTTRQKGGAEICCDARTAVGSSACVADICCEAVSHVQLLDLQPVLLRSAMSHVQLWIFSLWCYHHVFFLSSSPVRVISILKGHGEPFVRHILSQYVPNADSAAWR